jgi:hypothetical protein
VTATVERAGALRWALDEPFLVRYAGLPVECLEELRASASAVWAGSVLDLEERLRELSEAASDALAAAVADRFDDEQLRRRLINLRRDVFNGRGDRADIAALAAEVDTHTADLLHRWRSAWTAHRTALERGATVVRTDLDRQRRALRMLAGEPALRAGLVLASPVLDRQLPTFLDAIDGPLGKRARRIERSLGEYVMRTAAKTSPFSTFTALALGRFEPDGPLIGLEPAPARSFVRLNLGVLARLSAAVIDAPELVAGLPVRLTNGWRVDQGRVRYLRRSKSAVVTDDDAAFVLDFLHENVFYLPDSPLLADAVEVLAAGREPSLADLVERLVAGCRDRGDTGSTTEDVRSYVGHLVRLGLLMLPSLRIDINAADPAGQFRAQLAAIGLPWAVRLASHLGRVDGMVRGYGTAGVEERRTVVAAVRDELDAALVELGQAGGAPRTLLYEDTATPTRARASAPRWAAALRPALGNLAAVLPAFDVNLPRRLTTKGYFRARYGRGGRCDDVTSFAHEFHQDFYAKYAERQAGRPRFDESHRNIPHENWFDLPELAALDTARNEVAGLLDAGLRQLPPEAPELSVDPGAVGRIAAGLPDNLGGPASWSFFLQLAGDTAVVNRCYTGLTQQFSRFAHCFDDGPTPLPPELGRTLAAAKPTGALFAELKGGYEATNLNLHPAVTPYELVCQGELAFRPADQLVPVEDLYIVDDLAADRLQLRSRRLDREVIPVYLGFLVPTLLPEVQQVLHSFGPAGMAHLDLWAGVAAAHPDRPVVALPRVRLGDLVLQRRTWRVPTTAVPSRTGDESAAFLNWARWRRQHRLPRQVFAAGAGAPSWHTRTKPVFIDFEQHLSVGLLADLARDGDGVVLTEMLPGRDRLWLRDPRGSYVSELVVQLTSRGAASA